MASSTCSKCGATIQNDFSRGRTWYYLDHRWRAWRCYAGKEHKPSRHSARTLSAVPYEQLIREADADLFYQWGLHEFAPGYCAQYVANQTASVNREIIDEIKRTGSEVEINGPRPPFIVFSGTKYFEPQYAAQHKLPPYAEIDPSQFDHSRVHDRHYLVPNEIADALRGFPDRRPPFRTWISKIVCHVIGRYPCTKCHKFFRSSEWINWIGQEPSIDVFWAGPLCINCLGVAPPRS